MPIQPSNFVRRRIINEFFYYGVMDTMTFDDRDLVNIVKSLFKFINTANGGKLM